MDLSFYFVLGTQLGGVIVEVSFFPVLSPQPFLTAQRALCLQELASSVLKTPLHESQKRAEPPPDPRVSPRSLVSAPRASLPGPDAGKTWQSAMSDSCPFQPRHSLILAVPAASHHISARWGSSPSFLGEDFQLPALLFPSKDSVRLAANSLRKEDGQIGSDNLHLTRGWSQEEAVSGIPGRGWIALLLNLPRPFLSLSLFLWYSVSCSFADSYSKYFAALNTC